MLPSVSSYLVLGLVSISLVMAQTSGQLLSIQNGQNFTTISTATVLSQAQPTTIKSKAPTTFATIFTQAASAASVVAASSVITASSVTPTPAVTVSATPTSPPPPKITTPAIGNIPAPAITNSGDPKRPFAVNGNTFTDLASANERACAIQNNECADAVNSGQVTDATVADCSDQETVCNNFGP